jgi:hypothetical protein
VPVPSEFVRRGYTPVEHTFAALSVGLALLRLGPDLATALNDRKRSVPASIEIRCGVICQIQLLKPSFHGNACDNVARCIDEAHINSLGRTAAWPLVTGRFFSLPAFLFFNSETGKLLAKMTSFGLL